MKNLLQKILLRYAIIGGLIVTLLFAYVLLRGYAVHLQQSGCWSIKTSGIFIDLGSEPTCYKRDTP